MRGQQVVSKSDHNLVQTACVVAGNIKALRQSSWAVGCCLLTVNNVRYKTTSLVINKEKHTFESEKKIKTDEHFEKLNNEKVYKLLGLIMNRMKLTHLVTLSKENDSI